LGKGGENSDAFCGWWRLWLLNCCAEKAQW